MYSASVRRMPDPKHKSNVTDRNPKTTETLLGATKTAAAATMTMTTDEEEPLKEETERRKKKARSRAKETEDKRGRSSCFVWSRPMYNAKFGL